MYLILQVKNIPKTKIYLKMPTSFETGRILPSGGDPLGGSATNGATQYIIMLYLSFIVKKIPHMEDTESLDRCG